MTNDKQREKLVELFEQLEDPSSTCPRMGTNARCEGCKYLKRDGCDLTGRFVDYFLANGVIVPPCKVGQDIYTIQCDEVTKHFVIEVAMHNNGETYCKYVPYDKKGNVQWFYVQSSFTEDAIGKTVFLTKEEAEQALVTDNNVGSKKEEGAE